MEIIGGRAENYFRINLLSVLRLFLIAVVGRRLSAYKLVFSGTTRAQVSEGMSSSILPEARKRNTTLRKRDVDENGLRKVQLK